MCDQRICNGIISIECVRFAVALAVLMVAWCLAAFGDDVYVSGFAFYCLHQKSTNCKAFGKPSES